MSEKTATILVADDDQGIRQLLRVFLERADFRVVLAQNGDEAVRLAQENVPDLILVDVMMPQMDGYEVCRQLRNDTRTSHVPILMLTSLSTVGDKLSGFESGADDYVTKPFDLDEVLARVRSMLRRAREIPVRSPLTGLPGNRLLQEELRHRLQRGDPLALLYVDMDNFKAFNDAYGFVRGDEAIKLLARLIQETVAAHGASGDFIGHIGGDDFAVITQPQYVETICSTLIERFDAAIPAIYDPLDLERGYLRGYDRVGVPHRFPMMTISIGVVTNCNRTFESLDEIGRIAAEMKRYAKRMPGGGYAVDQRGGNPVPVLPDRRGLRRSCVVAVAGAEQDLLQLLQLHLEKAGHRVRLYHSGRELLAASGAAFPSIIILDALQADGSAWDLCRELREIAALKHRPILLISTDPEDEERAFRLQIDAFLLKPFSLKQFAACVNGLVARCPAEPVDRTGVHDESPGGGR
jgi:diguanylate cyclase (GGDEF)-like protein